VDPVKAELGPRSWDIADANWLARARRGVGVTGPFDTKTAYFWNRTGWGGRLLGACAPPKPDKPKDPKGPPGHDPGGPGGGHGGGGGGGGDASPPPDPSPPPAP